MPHGAEGKTSPR